MKLISNRCMIVFAKTKLSQLGITCLRDWDHECRITLALKWSYVWLCQYMLQSQRFAAMRIGCYEPVYNFIQILDLWESNFEKSYERMRRKWGNSPNIPGQISREWFELQRRNSGCWSTPSIFSHLFSYVLDEGWWSPKNPTISGNLLVGKRRAVARSP